MEFIDLKSQQKRIYDNVLARICSVLNHGQYIMGPEVQELECELAKYTGSKYCVSASSGTDTLLMALMALGVGKGDEVITTPFSFFATAEVILLLGAKPVFVDINPNTYCIDPKQIEQAITKKVKAIIPVSLYGLTTDWDEINEIAENAGIPVIEDGAQSFGSTYKQKKSCSLSTIGSTSFFPSKPLGCYGDGGALFTDNEELAIRLREIRLHGQERRYLHSRIGINGRLDTIQAAILLEKLNIFDDEVAKRHDIAKFYNEGIDKRFPRQEIPDYCRSVYAQYTIEVENRNNVVKKLNESGIPTAVHYPKPLHLQPALSALGYKIGDFPISESASERVLSLPMSPYLEFSDQARVIEAINSI